MANNMSMTYNEQKKVWRFLNSDAPAREIFLTPEELEFIINSRKRERWYNDLHNQIIYDEDNLDFSTISKAEFISLCLDDIDSNVEIYGYDDYDPDAEDIVFSVAQENGMWRD